MGGTPSTGCASCLRHSLTRGYSLSPRWGQEGSAGSGLCGLLSGHAAAPRRPPPPASRSGCLLIENEVGDIAREVAVGFFACAGAGEAEAGALENVA